MIKQSNQYKINKEIYKTLKQISNQSIKILINKLKLKKKSFINYYLNYIMIY